MSKETLTPERQRELNDKLLIATRDPKTTAEQVRALLDAGADVNAVDEYESTALHWAAERGNKAVVGALIDGGADVKAKNKWGKTALHFAAKEGRAEVVRELLTKTEVDFNAKDPFGRTALHFAAREGRAEVVRELLTKTEVDFNAIDQFGRTALHFAAEREDVSGFATIITTFSDELVATVLTSRDKEGKRPLDILAEKVEDKGQKKELAKIAKHIGGILREENPELKKKASLRQGLTDVYQSFCQKIGITTERARVKAKLSLNSSDVATSLMEGLKRTMRSTTTASGKSVTMGSGGRVF